MRVLSQVKTRLLLGKARVQPLLEITKDQYKYVQDRTAEVYREKSQSVIVKDGQITHYCDGNSYYKVDAVVYV